jgi:hypothetical protein
MLTRHPIFTSCYQGQAFHNQKPISRILAQQSALLLFIGPWDDLSLTFCLIFSMYAVSNLINQLGISDVCAIL